MHWQLNTKLSFGTPLARLTLFTPTDHIILNLIAFTLRTNVFKTLCLWLKSLCLFSLKFTFSVKHEKDLFIQYQCHVMVLSVPHHGSILALLTHIMSFCFYGSLLIIIIMFCGRSIFGYVLTTVAYKRNHCCHHAEYPYYTANGEDVCICLF